MNAITRVLLLLVLTSLCLFPPSVSLGDEGRFLLEPKQFHIDSTINFSFPKVVGGLEASDLLDYENKNKGLGYSIAYVSQPGEMIDVYVYDAGQPASKIRNGTGSPAVARQMEIAIGDIDKLERAGIYQDLRAIDNIFPAIREAVGDFFLLKGFSLMNKSVSDRKLESVVMLRSFRGKFMKIRATYIAPALDGGEGARHVSSFVKDFRTILESAAQAEVTSF